MPIGLIIVTLLVVGVALWLINQYVPMAAPVKTILNIVVVLLLVVWLLNILGIMSYTLPVRK